VIIYYLFSDTTYHSIGISVIIHGIVYVPKHANILKADLKSVVTKHFLESPIISMMMIHQHTVA